MLKALGDGFTKQTHCPYQIPGQVQSKTKREI